MGRLAALEIRAFVLQCLYQKQPDWRARPTVVVAHDRASAAVTWASPRAERAGVRVGMRYAEALSLCSEIRAGVVSDAEVADRVAEVLAALEAFSPRVEPAREEPGLFWLDVSGLDGLYPSLARWGALLLASVQKLGFRGAVAVGFGRFETSVLVRSVQSVEVWSDPLQERKDAWKAELSKLPLGREAQTALHDLGLHKLGAFLALPASSVRSRFGAAAARIHQLGTGAVREGLTPVRPPERVCERVSWDEPVGLGPALLASVMIALKRIFLERLQCGEVIESLALTLSFDGTPHRRPAPQVLLLQAALPTRNLDVWRDLLSLRLETLQLFEGVVEVQVEAFYAAPLPSQQAWPQVSEPRLPELHAALARIGAEIGVGRVGFYRLEDRHLPEASFSFVQSLNVRAPRVLADAGRRGVVRRRLKRPHVVQPPDEPVWIDEITGGWWVKPVHRRYALALDAQKRVQWLYFDVLRGQWVLQGWVS